LTRGDASARGLRRGPRRPSAPAALRSPRPARATGPDAWTSAARAGGASASRARSP